MLKVIPYHGNPEAKVYGIVGATIGTDEGKEYVKLHGDMLNVGWEEIVVPSPTPTPTPTPTVTPTMTPTITPTPSVTPTITPTKTVTPTPSRSVNSTTTTTTAGPTTTTTSGPTTTTTSGPTTTTTTTTTTTPPPGVPYTQVQVNSEISPSPYLIHASGWANGCTYVSHVIEGRTHATDINLGSWVNLGGSQVMTGEDSYISDGTVLTMTGQPAPYYYQVRSVYGTSCGTVVDTGAIGYYNPTTTTSTTTTTTTTTTTAAPLYTIGLNIGTGGTALTVSGVGSAPGSYNNISPGTYTLSSTADTGYSWSGYSVTCGYVNTAAQITTVTITGNGSITGLWTAGTTTTSAPGTYYLSTPSSPGSLKGPNGEDGGGGLGTAGSYTAGSTVNVTMTPNSNSDGTLSFDGEGVVAGPGPNSATVGILMNANRVASATWDWRRVTYTVGLAGNGGGSVSSGGIVPKGSTPTVVATVPPGSVFAGWSGNNGVSFGDSMNPITSTSALGDGTTNITATINLATTTTTEEVTTTTEEGTTTTAEVTTTTEEPTTTTTEEVTTTTEEVTTTTEEVTTTTEEPTTTTTEEVTTTTEEPPPPSCHYQTISRDLEGCVNATWTACGGGGGSIDSCDEFQPSAVATVVCVQDGTLVVNVGSAAQGSTCP
jgi:hypothetical protein